MLRYQMEVRGQLDDPATLALGKEPPVPNGQEYEWAQSQFGRESEEKTLYYPYWEPNVGRPSRRPVTILPELPPPQSKKSYLNS
jgi:hypothetical protein